MENNFFVDYGFKSLHTEEKAFDLLKRIQDMFAIANLRLHKMVSKSDKVMKTFPSDIYADLS